MTKGKPTLGMVLISLLLQEAVSVRVFVVDTSTHPVIERDDVRFALRLASDRGFPCSYEFAGQSDRAFSSGKARIVRALDGPFLCLVDDDVVMPSNALARMVETAARSGTFGYISPHCKNSPPVAGDWGRRPSCTAGSLIYQDALVHRILLDYYDATVDVLDRRKTANKVWETAFLTTLFDALGRPCIRQDDLVTYHLDYQEGPRWIDEERTVIARSAQVARDLAYGASEQAARSSAISAPPAADRTSGRDSGLVDRARRALGLAR